MTGKGTVSKRSRLIPWLLRGILLVVIVLLAIASVRGFSAGKLIKGPDKDLLETVEGSDYSKIWEGRPLVEEDGRLSYKCIMFSGWKDFGQVDLTRSTYRIRAAGRSGRAKLIIKRPTGAVVYCKNIEGKLQKINLERPGPYRVYLVGAWYSATTELLPE